MKKPLLFYPVGPILLLVGAFCAGLLLPSEMQAANKNVWIEYPVDTYDSAKDMTVCIGQAVTFTARTSHPPGFTWSWSGATISGSATNHPTSDASKTFSTAGGPFSVTATYNSETSHAARVTVVEVASLLPSEGTLVGGAYIVCVGAGDVVVTATPNPSLPEGSLPPCWSFTATAGVPIGSGLLQRKVSKSTPGITTFTATAGTSSKSVTIKVVEVASVSVTGATSIGNDTWVACKGGGTVTITATSNPSVSDAELTGTCWTTIGGTGTANLTRTVSTSAAIPTTISFTAGSSSKSATIKVVEVASVSVTGATSIGNDTWVACKGGGTVTVTATSNPSLSEGELVGTCWNTVGGTGTAKLTRTVGTSIAAPTTITFTAGSSSKSATIKVVEVASVTVTGATSIGGDTWVACKGGGTVTVTATSNPSLTEAELAGTCWTTDGGTGTAKLTRTVGTSMAGTTPITFTAGSSTRTVTIKVVALQLGVTGVQEVGKADHFLNLKASGDAVVTATLTPADVTPSVITWTGGNAGGNNLIRIVPSTAPLTTGIQATIVGNQCSVSVTVHMIDALTPPAAAIDAPKTWSLGGTADPGLNFGLTVVSIGQQGVTRPD